ncbi:hypothetical protein I3760_15G105800 [Carya illinoinensis]|nr:hypothetical protein I3760_15G105800 [Carya illinoinensis]
MADVEVQRDHDLWAGGFENKLIDMLFQETLEGKLVGSKITNRDCVRLAEQLNNLRIKWVDSSQVKGKIARLKKIQRQFTDLMGQTSMGWNPITKTIIGSDEYWANAIQVRSEWKKFKNNSCGNYDVLCMIFDQVVATGVLHFASTQEPPSREEEQHLEDELRARGPVFGTSTRLDSTIDLDAIEITLEMQGRASKVRAELDVKMFDLCNSKHSRGKSSNIRSDAGYNSVAQCMQFLYDITPPLPLDVQLAAAKAFLDPNMINVF